MTRCQGGEGGNGLVRGEGEGNAGELTSSRMQGCLRFGWAPELTHRLHNASRGQGRTQWVVLGHQSQYCCPGHDCESRIAAAA